MRAFCFDVSREFLEGCVFEGSGHTVITNNSIISIMDVEGV